MTSKRAAEPPASKPGPPTMSTQAQAKLMLAGGLAGAAAKTCTAPLGRLTILYQVNSFEGQQPSVWQGLRRIVQTQGVIGLWRGHTATLLHRMPYSAVNFAVFENTVKALTPLLRSTSEGGSFASESARYLIAGGAGGSVGCAVAYPLDLVKTKLTADLSQSAPRYKGLVDCCRQILRREGVRGLYKGLNATLLQVTPTLAINFTAYEMSKAAMMSLLHVHEPRPVSTGVPRGSPHNTLRNRGAAPPPPPPPQAPAASCAAAAKPDLEHVAPVSPHIAEDPVTMDRELGMEAPCSQRNADSHADANGSTPPAASGRGGDGASSSGRGADNGRTGRSDRGSSGGGGGPYSPQQARHAHSRQHAALDPELAEEWEPQRQNAATGTGMNLDGAPHSAAGYVTPGHRRVLPLSAAFCSAEAPPGGGAAQPARAPAAAMSSRETFKSEAVASKAVISLMAGSASGVVSSTLTFPLDVVRRNLQAREGLPESYANVVRRLHANGGWRAFYKGLLPEYLKVIPSVSIAFCFYEMLKTLLDI